MRITFRLIISLLVVAATVSGVFSYIQVESEKGRLKDDLERRSAILAESLQESAKEFIGARSLPKLKRLVNQFGKRDRLAGVAVFDVNGELLASTPGLLSGEMAPAISDAIAENRSNSEFKKIDGVKLHLYAAPFELEEGQVLGALVVLHDASYIDSRLMAIWKNNFIRLMTLCVLITLTTVLVVRWSITGPIADFAEWLKNLRTGKPVRQAALPRGDVLGPLAEEIKNLARSLSAARDAAKEEARLRVQAESVWTAERLKEYVRQELGGKNLYVISNREPYMHVRKGRSIEPIVPAGGVVTALDPIMRACGGVWIAHGSGDADRVTSDSKGRLTVPPDEPLYTLKRVWLSKEEEEGYYYGFSNEGLWPLCHITHTRPVFRLEDWIHYQKVNEKFAQALLEEIEEEESPLVLVQDYHFALLPLLIKSKRPDARVGIFWHIPWPNPEVFGICPWKEEILLGLLGADFIGFQTQFYCNNFLETVDRTLESRVDWDQFSAERRGQLTFVKPFPISVAFPEIIKESSSDNGKEDLLKGINVQSRYLGVGVDRIDYTKGITERFKAVERFLEKYPEFVGQFTFVELGAPSRTLIKRYHELMNEVESTAEKINWRFQTRDWKPIVFLKDHHGHEKIYRFYRAADVCMVTSLHDGMNLVAKEFVASRQDEDGVLILSQFTGASRELHDAILVNPYDIEDMAEALHTSVTMEDSERADRMRRLREVVRERNIYRWAANLVTALSRVRLDRTVEKERGNGE